MELQEKRLREELFGDDPEIQNILNNIFKILEDEGPTPSVSSRERNTNYKRSKRDHKILEEIKVLNLRIELAEETLLLNLENAKVDRLKAINKELAELIKKRKILPFSKRYFDDRAEYLIASLLQPIRHTEIQKLRESLEKLENLQKEVDKRLEKITPKTTLGIVAIVWGFPEDGKNSFKNEIYTLYRIAKIEKHATDKSIFTNLAKLLSRHNIRTPQGKEYKPSTIRKIVSKKKQNDRRAILKNRLEEVKRSHKEKVERIEEWKDKRLSTKK